MAIVKYKKRCLSCGRTDGVSYGIFYAADAEPELYRDGLLDRGYISKHEMIEQIRKLFEESDFYCPYCGGTSIDCWDIEIDYELLTHLTQGAGLN